MNKNIKQVLVKVEYHGQVWYEYISVENSHEICFRGGYASEGWRHHKQIDGQGFPKEHRV